MQKTWCDNCGREILTEKPEIAAEDWKPQPKVTLQLHISGTGRYLIDLDLCGKCAKKYMRKLKEPLDD